MEELASIPLFFRHRDVLVTGGSGFVGRVLVEKLLRSCPDVGTVFLLLRPRKGVSPLDRLAKLTGVELFDRLREEQPGALSKLRVVAGDTSQPGLGLSAEDAEMLVERVSVVFNLAASVRFDDSLDKAVRVNVFSARSLMELAVHMPHLKALVHVSTTYCNRGEEVYDEKLYPPPADWRSVVKAVESADPVLLRILTDKILGEHGNTYTFSKVLAEHAINEYADRLPIAILRPSVVVATALEPVPGWIDNFNGPMGLLVGAAKGIVHTGHCDPDAYLDYIPCDVIVKGLIICCWEVAKRGVSETMVYQGAQSNLNRITQKELINMTIRVGSEMPLKDSLYYPCGTLTKYFWLYYIQNIFFHLLPAIIVDFTLSASGRKPLLVGIQRKIYQANKVVHPFVTRSWNFVNKQFLGLEDKLVESDKAAFGYKIDELYPYDFFRSAIIGMRKYKLKEKDENLPLARKRYQRLRVVHLTLKTLYYICLSWLVLTNIYAILFGN